jgi:hypothetical protein
MRAAAKAWRERSRRMSATPPRIVAALTGPRPVRLAALLSDPEETYRGFCGRPQRSHAPPRWTRPPPSSSSGYVRVRECPGRLDFVALKPVLDADRQQRKIAEGAAVPPRDPAVGRFAVFRTVHRSAV